MRKMKKFATGGRAERGQARYDRMMKDIESDYEKAKGRKTGRAAEVAKAKYEQRMADAKDDLAKARGEDRTQTRAAEAAAERELTMTRRYGARKIPGLEDADKPLVSARPSDAELTKLTAGVGQKLSDAGNFGSAFAAARKAGDKTFSWRGKSYTTEMAGEKKPVRASTSSSSSGPKPRGDAMAAARSRGISDFIPKKNDRWSGAKPGNLPKPDGKKPFDTEAAKAVFRNFPTKPAAAAPAAKPKTREQERKLREAVAKTGTRSSFAKGGSIDGIAKRGKTKAKRK